MHKNAQTHVCVYIHLCGAVRVALILKNLPVNARDVRDIGSIPGPGRSPGGGAWQPTPVLLPAESHGQMNLVGYNPWDRKELDMTEVTLQYLCIHIYIYIYIYVKFVVCQKV